LSIPLHAVAFACLSALVVAAMTATGPSPGAGNVACNRWNECWRVHGRFAGYPRFVGVVFHDDRWASNHTGVAWRWRPDRDDRGYYLHGVWQAF
jgi:hypothetical protein